MEKFNESDVPIASATTGDMSDAMRQSKWYSNLGTNLVCDFLREKNICDVYTNTVRMKEYEKWVRCACLEEFFKAFGYDVVRALNTDSDDIKPFEYENLEVDYGVHKKVPSEGMFFLSHRKECPDGKWYELPFVFSMESLGPDTYMISVKCQKKYSDVADKFMDDLGKFSEKNNYLKGKKIAADLSFIEPNPRHTWESLILDEKTKEEIRKNVDGMFSNMQIYELNGISFKRGVILKGVPGVGKTLVGKILCNTVPCAVVWVTPAHLSLSYKISAVCDLARSLSPAILFLEDIDLYGAGRDSNINKSVLGELMNQLDGIKENKNIVVVATTNRSGEIEEAIRNRPGRFDSIIEVKAPEEAERLAMLKHYTENIECKDVDFMTISRETEGYTGAHVKDLVDLAIMAAIDSGSYDKESKRITLEHDHFYRNIKTVGKRKIEIGFGTGVKKRDRPILDDILERECYPED